MYLAIWVFCPYIQRSLAEVQNITLLTVKLDMDPWGLRWAQRPNFWAHGHAPREYFWNWYTSHIVKNWWDPQRLDLKHHPSQSVSQNQTKNRNWLENWHDKSFIFHVWKSVTSLGHWKQNQHNARRVSSVINSWFNWCLIWRPHLSRFNSDPGSWTPGPPEPRNLEPEPYIHTYS